MEALTDYEHLKDFDYMYNSYIVSKLRAVDIAIETGYSEETVLRWLKRHGISVHMRGWKVKYLYGKPKENWSWYKDGLGWKRTQERQNEIGKRSKEYGDLVLGTLERDGYACTECESTMRLEVHHKKPWIDYPELRFDLGNLTTLCHSCHKRKHIPGL